MLRVAWIHDHRVQHRAVGSLILRVVRPRLPHLVVVEPGDRRPRVATVVAAEEALRRGARVPDARLVGMTGAQPNHGVDAALERVTLDEGRRPRRLGPCLAEIGRPEDRRPEVSGPRRHEERPPIAGVLDDVLDDLTQEDRAFAGPGTPFGIGREQPRSLASADQKHDPIVAPQDFGGAAKPFGGLQACDSAR